MAMKQYDCMYSCAGVDRSDQHFTFRCLAGRHGHAGNHRFAFFEAVGVPFFDIPSGWPAGVDVESPGNPIHVELWDAINDFARACGGDPSKHISTFRMATVAKIERALSDMRAAVRSAKELVPSLCPRCGNACPAGKCESP